ncbi:hypothetical protein BLA29_013926 [Euroglyphus maynei]|uniref:Uncharacterized protein n=1 Tax=Euroglyphus maynei TaxID=6958 RepID=A0A1Y3BQ48_EURMA|nr:hypothetical protein BLA29_013926 [Euroglyphus maynei]
MLRPAQRVAPLEGAFKGREEC